MVTVGAVGAGLMWARAEVLAHAKIDFEGERIDFQLRERNGSVEALVREGAGLVRSRRLRSKPVYGVSPAMAQRAEFDFDADRRQAKFSCEEGGVVFQFDGSQWEILPWITRLN